VQPPPTGGRLRARLPRRGHRGYRTRAIPPHYTNLLPGIADRAFIDIDSLLRPVFGKGKQGASFGHTKIASKQVLRKGLSPLATTISTTGAAPVVGGIRLRAGKASSGRGAATMVREAIGTARDLGATGTILTRGDSAFGTAAVVNACIKEGVQFSVVLSKNPAVARAIAAIGQDAWTPGPRCITRAPSLTRTPGR